MADPILVDSSTLVGVSIGSLVALLGVVVAAAVSWTKMGARMEALAKDVRAAMRAGAEANALLTDHRHADNSIHQQLDLRVHLIERELELVTPRPVTVTNPPPHSGRHRPVDPDPSESR